MADQERSTRYRRKRGFSRQRFHALKKKGKIKFDANGKVDDQATDATLDASRQAAQAIQQRSPSKQVLDYYQAKTAQLDYEAKIGKLVLKDDVEREAFKVARRVRDAMLNIPNRLAGIVAAETDQAKVHAILTREIHQALESLAQESTAHARPAR